MARKGAEIRESPKVKDYGDWWHEQRYILRNFGTCRNSPRSRQPEAIRSLLDNHIYPVIGDLRMLQVDHTHKAKLIKRMSTATSYRGKPYSKATIGAACIALHTMFADALEAGYPLDEHRKWFLDREPAWRMVETPEGDDHHTEVPTPELIAGVLVALATLAEVGDRELAQAAQVCAWTVMLGLRAQEARLLRWGQLDLRPDVYDPAAGQITLDGADVKTGRKLIRPVPHAVLRFLPERPARADFDHDMRVWPDVSHVDMRKTLRKALEAAGAKQDFTILSMRHAAAQALERAGLGIAGIRKFFDHRSLATTERYLRSGHTEAEKREAAEKLAARLQVGL